MVEPRLIGLLVDTLSAAAVVLSIAPPLIESGPVPRAAGLLTVRVRLVTSTLVVEVYAELAPIVNWPPPTAVVAVVTLPLNVTPPACVLVTPVATVTGPPPIVYVPMVLDTATELGETPAGSTV